MKGKFSVLKYKYIAIGCSLLFIAAGVVVWIALGFNTSVDFGSGYSAIIQLAPLGATISYKQGWDSPIVVGASANTLYLETVDSNGAHRVEFPASLYPTVDDLAVELRKYSIDVHVINGSLHVSDFRPGLTFPATLSQSSIRLNYATESMIVSTNYVRKALASLGDANVQALGNTSNDGFLIRIKAKTGDTQRILEGRIRKALDEYFGEENIVVVQSDFVGAKFSASILRSSIYAMVLASFLILVYISIRFKPASAIASILTLFHDIAMMVAFILVFRMEVSTTTVAAVLTIIGYSLTNTVVILNRVRENLNKKTGIALPELIDLSVRQSFSRSLFTALTTLLAILPLAIFGSGDIRNFAINLSWGVVVGAYSANFLVPVLLLAFNSILPIEDEKQKRVAGKR